MDTKPPAKVSGLVPVIARYLEDQNKKPHRNKPGEFHPSEMGRCARSLYYSYIGTEARQCIPAKLKLIFEHGHAIHTLLQDMLKDIYGGRFTAEVEVKTDHPIVGHADGLLELKSGKVVVIEIKSANDASYKKASSPLPGHAEQGHIYAGCLGVDSIRVLYYNKNDKVEQGSLTELQLKEFLVPFDQTIFQAFEAKIAMVKECAQKKTPPPQEISNDCKTCRFFWTCQPQIV
jgi:CRISPR/Cas system-associated exonuclease Cas4 (RecB family)